MSDEVRAAAELRPAAVWRVTRSELKRMGWWCSDTAHLRFDRCRVPVANRVGAEGGDGSEEIMKDLAARQLGV